MSEFKIDKGIPLSNKIVGKPAKYPFAEMDIGDSFFIPNISHSDWQYKAVSGAARGYFKRHKKKFVIRSLDGGARVWRIA